MPTEHVSSVQISKADTGKAKKKKNSLFRKDVIVIT